MICKIGDIMSDNENFDLSVYDESEEETDETQITTFEDNNTEIQSVDADEELRQDYQEARQNYKEILNVTKEAINELLEIAKQTEHPRAFEVLGQLLGNITATNDKLVDVHKKIADIEHKKSTTSGKKSGDTFIENAVFTGSLADFQMKLKEMRKKSKNEDDTTGNS